MAIPEKFRNFFWGENKLFYPDEEFVFKMDYPRVFVRYNVGDGYFANFDDFFENIAEVQYLDGAKEKPSEKEQQRILIDIWNYIGLEERQLDNDLEDVDFDEL